MAQEEQSQNSTTISGLTRAALVSLGIAALAIIIGFANLSNGLAGGFYALLFWWPAGVLMLLVSFALFAANKGMEAPESLTELREKTKLHRALLALSLGVFALSCFVFWFRTNLGVLFGDDHFIWENLGIIETAFPIAILAICLLPMQIAFSTAKLVSLKKAAQTLA